MQCRRKHRARARDGRDQDDLQGKGRSMVVAVSRPHHQGWEGSMEDDHYGNRKWNSDEGLFVSSDRHE